MKVSLLDYGAGNVRSVRNAITSLGYEVNDVTSPDHILQATCLVFPGVGSFSTAMTVLQERKYEEPLKQYLQNHDRPFLGICLGMQTLFESSEESEENIRGLGLFPGSVHKFDDTQLAVPHIGWNGVTVHQQSPVLDEITNQESVYFVHSYHVPLSTESKWVLTSTTYGNCRFVSSIQQGAVVATQFHPEKSGTVGLQILKNFLQAVEKNTLTHTHTLAQPDLTQPTQLVKRVVVALDVRTNDDGDLVVTKGDQYDVREKDDSGKGRVRNLGKPVQLASRYYQEGADEIAFLNITSFRQGVLEDLPMLQVLQEASKNIFVPLTVGGGIRSYTDPETNNTYSALDVAARYFRAGADKVSLGSDAVTAAELFLERNGEKTGFTSIETISRVYGVQAVVISIDPKRVYLQSPQDVTNPNHVVMDLERPTGPNGERYCWYQCTVKGGRQGRDICAVTVAKACEALGAGEIMLNCIDMDGQGQGFDHYLCRAVSDVVSIPIIASSGAGKAEHFTQVFQDTQVQAALAAGMFHRKEVEIEDVKHHMREHGIPARQTTK